MIKYTDLDIRLIKKLYAHASEIGENTYQDIAILLQYIYDLEDRIKKQNEQIILTHHSVKLGGYPGSDELE